MKKFLLVLLTLFVLFGCSNIKDEVVKTQEEPVIEKTPIQEPVIEEPQEIITTTTLVMGGDALTHESVFLDNKTADGYDFTYPFEEIKKIVEPYDLAYYNQETVLGGKDYPITGYPVFNTPQEVGDGLIDAGFNLISLATNHLMDYYGTYGNQLILNQREYFLAHREVISSGSYKSNEDKEKIVIGEINGLTYALLSYTQDSNGGRPKDDEPFLINFINKEEIEKDVKKYRDQVDLLIVAMHWGEEGLLQENNYQKDYAQFLADLGVDIVVGTHPHVLEPIEWIDNTLVIYSLGNLYSNQYFNIDNLSSALVSADIVKTVKGDEKKIEIKNVKADLIFTVLDDSHKVYLYRDLTDEQLQDHDYYFNEYAKILKKYDDSIEVR